MPETLTTLEMLLLPVVLTCASTLLLVDASFACAARKFSK
jgi:hypothetical protein